MRYGSCDFSWEGDSSRRARFSSRPVPHARTGSSAGHALQNLVENPLAAPDFLVAVENLLALLAVLLHRTDPSFRDGLEPSPGAAPPVRERGRRARPEAHGALAGQVGIARDQNTQHAR